MYAILFLVDSLVKKNTKVYQALTIFSDIISDFQYKPEPDSFSDQELETFDYVSSSLRHVQSDAENLQHHYDELLTSIERCKYALVSSKMRVDTLSISLNQTCNNTMFPSIGFNIDYQLSDKINEIKTKVTALEKQIKFLGERINFLKDALSSSMTFDEYIA